MGIGSASKATYVGGELPTGPAPTNPANSQLVAPTVGAKYYDSAKATYDKGIADETALFDRYNEDMRAVPIDQAAYQKYSDEYDNRVNSYDMYQSPQYVTGTTLATPVVEETVTSFSIPDLYENNLGREGDVEGMAYWQGQRDSGMSDADLLTNFRNSARELGENPLYNANTTILQTPEYMTSPEPFVAERPGVHPMFLKKGGYAEGGYNLTDALDLDVLIENALTGKALADVYPEPNTPGMDVMANPLANRQIEDAEPQPQAVEAQAQPQAQANVRRPLSAQSRRYNNIEAQLQELRDTQSFQDSAQLQALRQESNAASDDIEAQMRAEANAISGGPSESEKWFRIAAALGAPTKTGNFFESLGNANAAMADVSKEEREAGSESRALGLAASKFALSIKNQNINMFSGQEKERRKALQDEIRYLSENLTDINNIQAEREYQEGQTVKAVAAREAGLVPGSPEYDAYIQNLQELELRQQQAELDALERKTNTLTTSEQKVFNVADEKRTRGLRAIDNLQEALKLSKIAFNFSPSGRINMAGWAFLSPNDPQVVATERLNNILSQGAIEKLKATFGGQISDGEREALKKLTGLYALSGTARDDMINQIINDLNYSVQAQNTIMTKVQDGTYYERRPKGDK